MSTPQVTTIAKALEPRDQRTPMAFLPYQQRWAKDTTPVKFCEKSRRIGLSWGAS